ncbi:hypothetical protein EFW58_02020 [Bacillus velezensis]|nr:hypothetical protein EFW58_02020 [Bacillus velezensis]
MLEHHVMHLLYKAYTHMRGLKFTRMNWDTAFRMEPTCGNWSTALEISS